MNQHLTQHLTEDDLDEILMGIGSTDAAAHLATCAQCEQRAAAFHAEMSNFNDATLAWSQARSNTLDRDLLAHKPTPRLTLTAAWSTAAAVALVGAFAVNILHHPAATSESTTASMQQAQTFPETHVHPQNELAADNAMLAAIDSEMSTPDNVQYELYQKTEAHTKPAPDSTPLLLRD